MRYLSIGLIALLVGCATESTKPQPVKPAAKSSMSASVGKSDGPLSNLNHPVNTKNAEAQRHFNDGLTLCYGFNHDEAVRSFEKALKADPNLAMAHWGIAFAVGPNYNLDVDADREKKGFAEIQKAIELAKDSPQQEKDYIAALAKRFSDAKEPDLKQQARDYANAMRELAKKYPDDLDAQTLFADSMMNLRPWELWTKDYKPAEGTMEIVSTLEEVLKRDPDHLGACHMYIHAVEASHHPERALEAAARLPGLAPSLGHLVHMPSHIYARVGEHESAVTSNEAAVACDREYLAANADMQSGMYAMMYYPHNIHFVAYAQSWQGNFAESKRWGDDLYSKAAPHVEHMPMLEAFTAVPTGLLIKFRKWDELVSSDGPDQKTMPVTAAIWHAGRGMAFARRNDLTAAMNEREKFTAVKAKVPTDAPFGMVNKARPVLDLVEHLLDARIAQQQKNLAEAERHLREAVAAEDSLRYMEPPDWLSPARETLGGVLLASNKPAEAEKAFRAELDRNPRGGRALYGLWKALDAQKKPYEAEIVRRQYREAWRNADTRLSVEDL